MKIINLGDGKKGTNGFVHLDKKRSSNISINFENMEELPFENESVDHALSVHCIEHLTDESNKTLMKETYRVLKHGGIFRISCPDYDIFFDLFKKDSLEEFKKFKNKPTKKAFFGKNIGEYLINVGASYVVVNSKGKVKKPYIKLDGADKIIKDNFNNFETQLDKENFINWIKKLIPDKELVHSILHKNGFNFERLKSFLKEAGFSNIVRQSYKESLVKELVKFDKFPKRSMFVEGIKK